MRYPWVNLVYFHDKILPLLKHPFVIVIAGEDVTIPQQVDPRWRRFSQKEQSKIISIFEHTLCRAAFVENLDAFSPMVPLNVRPLPLGVVKSMSPLHISDFKRFDRANNILSRPLKVTDFNRVRNGRGPWQTRNQVRKLCQTTWKSFALVQSGPHSKFLTEVAKYPFTLCVQGGGLNPCPKVWESILVGTIPIIKNNPMAPAFKDLPVVIVDNWTQESITTVKLQGWRRNLLPFLLIRPRGKMYSNNC